MFVRKRCPYWLNIILPVVFVVCFFCISYERYIAMSATNICNKFLPIYSALLTGSDNGQGRRKPWNKIQNSLFVRYMVIQVQIK